jgi:CheY-like chemotaxis protein
MSGSSSPQGGSRPDPSGSSSPQGGSRPDPSGSSSPQGGSRPDPSGSSSPQGGSRPDPSARVLIVDDEPNIVTSLVFLMERSGYEVRTAGDGAEALAAVDDFAPHLVVLDVMMPQVSGFEVCRRLRADPRHADLRILMLTAKGRDVEVAKGLELGADGYVTKPFSTAELVARVGALLEDRGDRGGTAG